jgi:hypothetical protein
MLRLWQDIGLDSNVLTLSDQALVDVTNRGSPFSRTGVITKYQMNSAKTFSFIPEFMALATFYGRRSDPSVYSNDNVLFAPALRTRYEHWSHGAPATFLFDVEYNYMLRDYKGDKTLPYYTRILNFSLGERVKWFNAGTTTLRFIFKFVENEDPSRNALDPGFTIQQNVRIGAYDLQNSLAIDYLRARDDINDEANARFRSGIVFGKFWAGVDASPYFALSFKDTMKQAPIRGTEILLNPGITFSRDFGRHWEANLDYNYSKNISKSKDLYEYTKNEAKIGVAYNY